MPFKSKTQARKCYALKAKGQAGSWDCSEWSDHTDFNTLPVRKEAEKMATIVSLAQQAARQQVKQAGGGALGALDSVLGKLPGLGKASVPMRRIAGGAAAAGTVGAAGAGVAGLMGGGKSPPPAVQPGAGAGPGASPAAGMNPAAAGAGGASPVESGGAAGGGGGKINLGTFHMKNAPIMQDIADNAGRAVGGLREGMGRIAGAAGGAVGGIGEGMGRAAEWIKQNPGQAALLGLGGVGVGYGLHRLTSGKKRQKEASFKPWTKAELIKRANDVKRQNAVIIFNRYLTKLARDADPLQARGLCRVQADLLTGAPLLTAVQRGFPNLGGQQLVKVARDLTKRAMQDFSSDLNNESSGSSFTGTPDEGASWMRSNC